MQAYNHRGADGAKGDKGDKGDDGSSGIDGSAIVIEECINVTDESLVPENTSSERYVVAWINTMTNSFTKIYKDSGSPSGNMTEITPIVGQLYVFNADMLGRIQYYKNRPYTWRIDEDSDFFPAETIGVESGVVKSLSESLPLNLLSSTSSIFGLNTDNLEIDSTAFPQTTNKFYTKTEIESDTISLKPRIVPEVSLPNIEGFSDYPLTTSAALDSTFSPLRFEIVWLNPADSTKRYFLRAIQFADKQILLGEHAELWLRKNLTFSSRTDYKGDASDNQALVVFEGLTGEQFHFGLVRTSTSGFPAWVAVDSPFLYHNTQKFKIGGDSTHYFSTNPNGTTFSLTRNSSPGLTYGTSTSFFNVLPDGTVRLAGAATTWDDLVSDVGVYREQIPAVSAPVLRKWKDDGSGSTGIYIYSFGKSAAAYSIFSFQMPHRWKEGSDIYAHVHWIPKTADSSTKKAVWWQLEYIWTNVADTAATNTSVITTTTHSPDEMLEANKHYISAFSAISGSGKTMSSILRATLSRQGGEGMDTYDTYADEAYILGFDIHYEIDSLGSAEEYVK